MNESLAAVQLPTPPPKKLNGAFPSWLAAKVLTPTPASYSACEGPVDSPRA
jgi:hypothetical protein